MSQSPPAWPVLGAVFVALAAVALAPPPPGSSPSSRASATPPAEQVVAPDAASDPPAPPAPGTPGPDPAQGLMYQNLRPSTDDGPCPGGYEVVDPDGPPSCSHGPDPAPADVDVRAARSTEELVAATAGLTEATATGGAAPSIQCYGDGVSGNRFQAVYARPADRPDRYAGLATSLVAYADHADASFADSAAETGGVRHVRWVTDPSCKPVVARVQLSATGDDSLSNMRSELASLGFNRTDRKYMVWVDSNVYCGIAYVTKDDRATADNANNRGPGYARVDSGCWGYTTSVIEAHEMMHNLGGVQLSAPHSDGGYHCTEENDRMCSGAAATKICPPDHERLFDCNHDDYFSTAVPAGSYLRTHWNVADSSFLEKAKGTPATTTTTRPPPATTTTTTRPTTTTTRPPSTTTTTRPPATTTTVARPPGAAVAYATTSRWDSGYNAQVDITNTTNAPVDSWVLRFRLSSATVSLVWDGTYSMAVDGTITVNDAGWNSHIGPGQKATFGFGASGTPSLPTSCTFNGSPCSFTGTA